METPTKPPVKVKAVRSEDVTILTFDCPQCHRRWHSRAGETVWCCAEFYAAEVSADAPAPPA